MPEPDAAISYIDTSPPSAETLLVRRISETMESFRVARLKWLASNPSNDKWPEGPAELSREAEARAIAALLAAHDLQAANAELRRERNTFEYQCHINLEHYQAELRFRKKLQEEAAELRARAEKAEAELGEMASYVRQLDEAETRAESAIRERDEARAATERAQVGLVEHQKHRDAWRSYAYGKRAKPTDFMSGNLVDRPQTEIERLTAALAEMREAKSSIPEEGSLDK